MSPYHRLCRGARAAEGLRDYFPSSLLSTLGQNCGESTVLLGQNEVTRDQDLQEILEPKGADGNNGSSPRKMYISTEFCRLYRLPEGDS